SSKGDQSMPNAAANRVDVPAANLGTHLYAKASCGGVAEYKCKEAAGDPNHYAAVFYLFASDITLEQAAGPSAGGVSGDLGAAAGSGAGVPPGPANGTNASTAATLTVAWRGTHSARLVTGYGHSEYVTGVLTGPGGVPIGGAQIDVAATPAAVGARPAAQAGP